MKTIAAWFTPERRQLIQVFFGSIAPLAILFGFGTEGVWEQSLIILGAVLQFISSALSLVNVRGALNIWTILRAAIYALAAVVSPALVVLGVYDEATNAAILVAVSLGLGALSNLLAIFVGKKQELEAVKADFRDAVRPVNYRDPGLSEADLVRRVVDRVNRNLNTN